MADVTGTAGPDVLNGALTDDVLRGLGGNDLLNGRGGRDRLEGGTGDDVFVVDSLDDLVIELAGEGSDTVYTEVDFWLDDSQHVEVVSSRAWAALTNLSLVGNAFANSLYGNAGNNFLDGGGSADVLTGFGGDDTYVVDQTADRVIEAAGEGFDVVYTGSNYRLAENSYVELLAARDQTATTALQLWGNSLSNFINGNAGANFIDGGAGADSMAGNDGDDVFVVDNAGDVVTEAATAGSGFDTVFTEVDYQLLDNTRVERLSARDWSSTATLNLYGNVFSNELYGNAGTNILDGGAGTDVMTGFAGDDTYFVRDRNDQVVETAGQGTDTIVFDPQAFREDAASSSFSLFGFAHVENLTTIAPPPLSNLRVNLVGNALANTLTGSNGSNTLDGGAGADIMQGLGGSDNYVVDDLNDVVIEAIGGGNDIIRTTVSHTLAAGSEVERITVSNVFTVGPLTLVGNELANTIESGAGNDWLDGKGGNDTLDGRSGSDSFAFTTALGPDNVDTLVLFNPIDTIVLENAVFTGLAEGVLSSGAFVRGTAAQDADDRIIYNEPTGELFFDADGNGAGAAILFAVFDVTIEARGISPPLDAVNFLVI